MKNLKTVLALLLILFILFSCSNERELEAINWEDRFNSLASISDKMPNADLIRDVVNKFSINAINSSFNTNFDVERVDYSKAQRIVDFSNNSSILIPIEHSKFIERDLFLILDYSLSEYSTHLLLTIEENRISYYDLKGRFMFDGRVENDKLDFTFNAAKSTQSLKCGWGGWGQNTSNCIGDAYTNHGWLSVWISVQTAFIPTTAAAIAGACAIKNFPCY